MENVLNDLQKAVQKQKEMENDPNAPSVARMIEIAEEAKKRCNKRIYQLKQEVKQLDIEIEHLKLLLQPKLFSNG